MPSMTTSSWLSASEPPPPIPPGNMKLSDAVHARGERRRAGGLRRALGEEALAPAAVLEDQVAGRVERAVGARTRGGRGRRRAAMPPAAPPKPGLSAWRRMPTASISSMKTMHWPPHLRASRFARRARIANDDRVDPDERRGEAGAGDRDERRVEAGRERLREHRLPGAGRAEEEQAALALAAGALERLAGLPDRDDAPHLLLRLGLPADVGELDAPLRVARLERLDLREVHDQQRAEEDHEVHDQEEAGGSPAAAGSGRAAPRRGSSQKTRTRAIATTTIAALTPEPPEPDAAPRDDVLLAELLALEAEQARRAGSAGGRGGR